MEEVETRGVAEEPLEVRKEGNGPCDAIVGRRGSQESGGGRVCVERKEKKRWVGKSRFKYVWGEARDPSSPCQLRAGSLLACGIWSLVEGFSPNQVVAPFGGQGESLTLRRGRRNESNERQAVRGLHSETSSVRERPSQIHVLIKKSSVDYKRQERALYRLTAVQKCIQLRNI
ncbi:hypothetical protein K432DRAFT_398126 [Lepidopterella palustris CBS 459.81]|uniref:Uncharacterized protein n=1 Tax=Lepidopterella palustris CBS 459.81 TaxID=1314670 RepID=A0A8E2JA36_9PEZI|nr:hypothetical protein K432DRAFT_398126 [Lepidopterella palustris CBS 459.81]